MDAECNDRKSGHPLCLDYELDGHRLHVCCHGPDRRNMLVELIDTAETSLKLYYYIFGKDESGRLILARLLRALRRGVDVTLMVDSFGSLETPESFFDSFKKAGGRIGWFGSSWSTRYLIRNHQKIAIADDKRAIVGGFNISDSYFGMPEDDCWHDMGIRIDGPEVKTLLQWYDQLWDWVSSPRQSFRALRRMVRGWHDGRGTYRWLIGGPTSRISAWARTVRSDLEKGQQVDMVAAYFTPGNSMLARLRRLARRGRARIVLAARSDNTATIAAARLLYGPLLRAGAQIYEYQPCKLHMKLIVIDDAVYIGSANFDTRSLFLNLEIMLRIESADFADMARGLVDKHIEDSEQITVQRHKERKTPFRLIKGWISYFLVGVLDYTITRRLNFRE
ncbi:MAG: cardiolipin synthase B [Sphingobium sp.]|nr:cardiolipin synthase B [Sphingobium sp.]MCP5399722.1 cardiolipin synthase B [Sphingomonas sp.]